MTVSTGSGASTLSLPSTNFGITWKTFVAGGIAGCCAKTTVAPLDRVKILLQAHNRHYRHLGVFSSLQHVIHKEGFLGLYKGNGVQMLRIFPYSAIQFGAYEEFKKILKSVTNCHTHIVKLTAGSLAGMVALVVTYPLDVVRSRLAFQVKGEHLYVGIVDTMKSIIHLEGGTTALYKGMVPSILGISPYAGLSFTCFEIMKNLCLDYFPDTLGRPCQKTTGGIILILPAKLLCGAWAGVIAQTTAYPLDVVRRRMQLSRMLPESHKYDQGWLRTLLVIYREDGVSNGLFRGLTVNYIRVIPTVAVSFATYETAKQMLGLDTGVDR
ncbi:solute carrier family 25 member 16 isoform X1 [Octopus bimaculoides]|uniref:Uncharacterized protein n=1 Tax=Octopus bimaculoides TaxID=37653 RepID=A0A0L8H1N6_OCTBM|nr:solute carrier family 25 member 16 isoform X1 [Octopus bimaculoides]|eukprot:XP_014776178.1 PREDICTED: graves disease carrier protein homolog [Octopus bimaculoides]